LDLKYSDEQRSLIANARSFFSRECPTTRVRAAEPLGYDSRLWQALQSFAPGELALPSDDALGGLLDYSLVVEAAGFRLAPVPVVEAGVSARVLQACCAPALLQQVALGEKIATLAPRPGPSQLIPAGAIADYIVWFDGNDLLLSETSPDAAHRTPRENLGSAPIGYWDLESPALPRTTLAESADAERLYSVARDTLLALTAASLVGLAAAALEIGVAYARSRKAFGQPIGAYQAIAHPFAKHAAYIDGARLLTRKACWAADNNAPEFSRLASMAYVFASEVAAQTSAHTLHAYGGHGYALESDPQLYYRRSNAWSMAVADPVRELQHVAGGLLAEARPAEVGMGDDRGLSRVN